MASERSVQARVLQDAGMELVRQISDFRGQLHGADLEPGHFPAEVLGDVILECTQSDRQGGEALIYTVVQLASNAPTLVLLRGQEAPRQALDVLGASLRGQLGALSREGVREDVGEEPKPWHQLFRPLPILRAGADRQ